MALAAFVSSWPAVGAEVTVPAEGRSLALTVYNQDLALVRDRRQVVLPAGETSLAFADVSPKMLAGSADLSGAGIRVAAQVVDFALLSPDSLLRRTVGGEVTLMRPATPNSGEIPVRGRLLSEDGPILDIGGHVEVAPPGRIVYDRLPEGLRAAPALSSQVTVSGAGRHDLDLTYLTSGLGWHAEYQLFLDESESKADLKAWVMLTNASGTSFQDADLTLASGDVHQAAAPVDVGGDRPRMLTVMKAAAPVQPMSEQAAVPEDLSGVALFHLAGPVSIDDRQSKLLALFVRAGVPARREIAGDPLPQFLAGQPFDPARNRDPSFSRPQSVLVLDGAGAQATTAPQGLVRVFRRDGAGIPRLLGEDRIGQKAKGETWRVALGRDGDIGITRIQTSFIPPKTGNAGPMESAWRITVINAKAQPVTVLLREAIPAGTAIVEESLPHRDGDARQAVWPIKVPAQGEAVLIYKVARGDG